MRRRAAGSGRYRLSLATGTILFGAFFILERITGGESPGPVDLAILRGVENWRSPMLTIVLLNITALGSLTLIVLQTTIAATILLSAQDRNAALQIALVSAGTWVSTEVAKVFIQRPRPIVISALAEASGFSFPSGHASTAAAMYITLAILVSRHLGLPNQRILIWTFTVFIVAAVALSRVYLGVHYPTDILGGTVLGLAWALVLEGMFRAWQNSRR